MLSDKSESQSSQQSQQRINECFSSYKYPQNQQIMGSIHGALDNINNVCYKSVRTMSQIATNIVYNAKYSNLPFMQRKQIKIGKGEFACLLGQKYSEKEEQQFLCKFSQIIWLSYRSQINGKVSDAGWGCMIRVCQMVIAQSLKQICPKFHISQIIKEFSENSPAIFSLDRICELGKINQRWTSSTQILAIMRLILESQTKYKLSLQIYSSAVSLEDCQQEIKYPLLITVNNRIGESSIPKQYFDNIYNLLDHPKSIGMIAGIGGQAVYIVGYHESSMILMDPHYIQTQKQGQSIHFRNIPRGISIEKIVPSLTFCFLVNSKKQHKEWLLDMAQINHFHHPFVGVQFDQKIAQKIYKERHPKNDQSDEQQFQVL